MKNIYSLASHILTLALPVELANAVGTQYISIGGEGSYLDNITVNIDNNLISIEGDYTGSWTVNKNLNAQGSFSISVNQMSPQIAVLKRICNMLRKSDYEGMTLTLTTLQGQLIATGNDCYIQKIPSTSFGTTPTTQTWTFISGKVVIE